MNYDLVTRADLEEFRGKLIGDIKELLSHSTGNRHRPWLKGTEVRKLLGISHGTLQSFRISGRLKASKIGGIYFYRLEDIEKMLGNPKQ